VTFPLLLQPKLVLDLATPLGCKAELTWVVGVSQEDSSLAKDGHLSQKFPDSVSRKSEAPTTEPPMERWSREAGQ